jgi:hypothetical protein
VGATEHLDAFVTRLGDITHTKLNKIPQVNSATDDFQASAALQERIREENKFDVLLYDYVVKRALASD